MEFRAPRRLAPARLGMAAAVALGLLILLLIGGSFAGASVRDWLHGRAPYRGDFLAIELDPPPPPWIKPGREGLLRAMLAGGGRLEPRHSTLDLDLQALDRAFRQDCPWIASVGRVERSYPNRVRVRVREYREPVATLATADVTLVLDAKGLVLPADDLDWEAAGPLMMLKRLPPADVARVGHVLELRGDDAETHRVTAPARLAGFLKPRLVARAGDAPPKIDAIYAPPKIDAISVPPGHASFWLHIPEKSWVYWGAAPGDEAPGEAPADRKWTLLRAWLDAHDGKPLALPQYLGVSKDRVEVLSSPGPS